MSAICGVVGPAAAGRVERMLAAVDYRGDRSDVVSGRGATLGFRGWAGRPGKAQGVHTSEEGTLVAVAGTLAPPAADPCVELDGRIRSADWAGLDGAFAAARWDGVELTLLRDPFGVRPLYWAQVGDTLWFASELKQLAQVPELAWDVALETIHAWLTFSFVPGATTPIRGVNRLLPGARLRFRDGRVEIDRWFELREDVSSMLADQEHAVRAVRTTAKAAVARRLNGEAEVGVFLSGGLDSSAVAAWLHKLGQPVHALSLDFGDASVEREQAAAVASALGIRHTWVPADGARVGASLDALVWLLDLPFGDAVTGPQLLLARAARDLGVRAVFNGEGGDQLFGGWTSKPMVAAALYGADEGDEEEEYLRSYHRFYGMEDELYTPALAEAVGGRLRRRELLRPYLGDDKTSFYLNRVRLADLSLKGCQNILPRAERITNGVGLDMRVPLFDRELAELSFRIPPSLKLHGACEKYVLKLAVQGRLPDDVVWRRKFGMSVPVTDWIFGPRGGSGRGPLYDRVADALSAESARRRGWFRPEYLQRLLRGEEAAGETRRRRLGEKVWALTMLELWARRFLDQGRP